MRGATSATSTEEAKPEPATIKQPWRTSHHPPHPRPRARRCRTNGTQQKLPPPRSCNCGPKWATDWTKAKRVSCAVLRFEEETVICWFSGSYASCGQGNELKLGVYTNLCIWKRSSMFSSAAWLVKFGYIHTSRRFCDLWAHWYLSRSISLLFFAVIDPSFLYYFYNTICCILQSSGRVPWTV